MQINPGTPNQQSEVRALRIQYALGHIGSAVAAQRLIALGFGVHDANVVYRSAEHILKHVEMYWLRLVPTGGLLDRGQTPTTP